MDERVVLATLQRRMAFGFRPGEWDAAVARGVAASVDALIAPDTASIATPADPWDEARIGDGPAPRAAIVYLVDAWLTRMVTTPRPLVEWMAWFWHGHFVSAFPKVKVPLYAVTQLRLFQIADDLGDPEQADHQGKKIDALPDRRDAEGVARQPAVDVGADDRLTPSSRFPHIAGSSWPHGRTGGARHAPAANGVRLSSR